jgi:phosphohistidine phosphatase
MEIYLFRHGIAEDGEPGKPDSARELTGEGRRKTADVMKLALKSGVRPTLILSSPYVRARQTAKIAAEQLGCAGDILFTDALAPHGSPENVWASIRDHAGEAAVLLAGHEPLLGRTAAYLLNSPALRIEMKKAALVRVDVDSLRAAPYGILRWMIVPGMT